MRSLSNLLKSWYWITASILALWPTFVLGCEPAIKSAENILSENRAVLVGYVSGDHYADYESSVLSGTDPSTPPVSGKRTVRVVVVDSIKGRVESKIIEAAVVVCGQRIPRVFDRVVISITTAGNATVVSWPSEEVLRGTD